jgi:hypothetical protein
MTSRASPDRGGSATTSLAGGSAAPPVPGWAGEPLRRSTAATSPLCTRAQGHCRRLYRASRTAAASASTPATVPPGPTAGASIPANSPAPQYRSSATSPGCGSSAVVTASVRASAAPGWTCQKTPALTRQSRPAAWWLR